MDVHLGSGGGKPNDFNHVKGGWVGALEQCETQFGGEITRILRKIRPEEHLEKSVTMILVTKSGPVHKRKDNHACKSCTGLMELALSRAV